MNQFAALVKGMALGAAVAYYWDPRLGRRRRASLRDAVRTGQRHWAAQLVIGWRDLRNRLVGAGAQLHHLLRTERPNDHVLTERVRAKMGHYVSHPGAIQVTARQGQVVLSGTVLSGEVDRFLRAISHVRGVQSVRCQFESHRHPQGISSLQGGRPRAGRISAWDEPWSPATRLLVGTSGTLFMANGLLRRSPAALLLGTLGFAAFLRSTGDAHTRQLLDRTFRPRGRQATVSSPRR